MEILVPLALYGWIPIVLFLFRDLKGHRGVAAAYVIAWLFLPNAKFAFYGLPDYGKVTATSLGIGLAVLLFDPRRLGRVRPRWIDIPMALFCAVPIAASLSNGLGLWDGLSAAMNNTLSWGIPYLLGRMYFDRLAKLKDLALAVVLGGLVYVPLCWIELRMSPQLYHWVYGFRPTRFNASRYGGWRPNVFLDTGLELGMWMTAASLLGIWLWYSGAVRKLFGLRFGPLLCVLVVTTFLCKSTGALLLLAGGTSVLVAIRWTRTPWPAIALAVVPLVYVGVRSTNIYQGAELVNAARATFGDDRARSLEFRFENERLLAARAWEQPLFGWGGWSRGRVLDEYGTDRTILDGMWIDVFGKMGLVGLVAFFSAFLIPPLLCCCRLAGNRSSANEVAGALALSVLLLLYAIDCLLNAMDNPVYALSLGALATLAVSPRERPCDERNDARREETSDLPPKRRLWPPTDRPAEAVVRARQALSDIRRREENDLIARSE